MKIILNCFGIENVQTKQAYKEAFNDLISKLKLNLNIELLDSIIVPNDFGSELTEFQLAHGLIAEYTDDDTGRAFGKTLTYKDNGQLCITVFIDKAILLGAFSDVPECSGLAVHLIHHELCHVHDNTVRYKLFGLDYILRKSIDFKSVLISHADIMWSEFIATKLSITSFYNECDMYIPYLLDLIKSQKEKCVECIDDYRFSGDINTLYATITLYSFYILRSACTVYGYLFGVAEMQDEDLYKQFKATVDSRIFETYFKDIWIEIGDILQVMDSEYPNWDSDLHIEDLSQTVLKMWNIMGIYPKETEEGLYIEVPY